MQPPQGVATAKALPVTGHSGSFKSFKESDLTIGSYKVTNIDRDWDKGSGANAGLWSRDAKKKAYRFDVQSQGRTLQGECTEQAVTHAVAGFGKTKVTFACTCGDGDTPRAKLSLVNGAGSVELGRGVKYDLAVVHQSEQGAQVSTALGYHFTSPSGEGAVDVTGNGRAWVPNDLDEEPLFDLVCGYAGLFLYRPTE
jgi:hypothetical protein